jgi:hypothetical protein
VVAILSEDGQTTATTFPTCDPISISIGVAGDREDGVASDASVGHRIGVLHPTERDDGT